jgi:hypothetical protein
MLLCLLAFSSATKRESVAGNFLNRDEFAPGPFPSREDAGSKNFSKACLDVRRFCPGAGRRYRVSIARHAVRANRILPFNAPRRAQYPVGPTSVAEWACRRGDLLSLQIIRDYRECSKESGPTHQDWFSSNWGNPEFRAEWQKRVASSETERTAESLRDKLQLRCGGRIRHSGHFARSGAPALRAQQAPADVAQRCGRHHLFGR